MDAITAFKKEPLVLYTWMEVILCVCERENEREIESGYFILFYFFLLGFDACMDICGKIKPVKFDYIYFDK